jgi:Na+-translocating ferredoxin:NAD+ oxidoreductase RnfG subunit
VSLGKVFWSRAEALELAFPDADRVESEIYVLTDDQKHRIEKLGHAAVDSKVIRIYTGFQGERVVGYAVIDVHNVRTLPEAFMVVLTPEGAVRSLRVLAFHEPLDYLPTKRWYEQFGGKTLRDRLRVGDDVHAVVGATLSAQATTRGVRRALAYYGILVQGGPN